MEHSQGVLINLLFQPDIFSSSRPGWLSLDESTDIMLSEVFRFLPKKLQCIDCRPEKSATFGINSSNFRFQSNNNLFLLKRWSDKNNPSDILGTLSVMNWLSSLRLPVPKPLKFNNNDFILKVNTGLWSIFPFIDGNYYTGANNQLELVADMTGLITQTLQELPDKIKLSRGPEFNSNREGEILKKAENYFPEWKLIFGVENAKILRETWPTLINEFEKLKELVLFSENFQPAHYDLHPHNILIKNNTVSAVLDFDSCKQINSAYAVAFAALKQCRQVIAYHDSSLNPKSIGERYMSIIRERYDFSRSFIDNLGDYAVAETIRRICLILELNLNKKNTRWNQVLITQLNHITEARVLFSPNY